MERILILWEICTLVKAIYGYIFLMGNKFLFYQAIKLIDINDQTLSKYQSLKLNTQ